MFDHGGALLRTCLDSTVAFTVVIGFQTARSARRHCRSLNGLPPPSEAEEERMETIVVLSALPPVMMSTANVIPAGLSTKPAL